MLEKYCHDNSCSKYEKKQKKIHPRLPHSYSCLFQAKYYHVFPSNYYSGVHALRCHPQTKTGRNMHSFRPIGSYVSTHNRQFLLDEPFFKFLRRNRPPQQVTLNLLAAKLGKYLELLICFNTLGDHRFADSV